MSMTCHSGAMDAWGIHRLDRNQPDPLISKRSLP